MASLKSEVEELIRRNLVRFRTENGLSQEEAAARAGISVDNLRRYEQNRTPDAVTLGQLAPALGHTVDHFYMPEPPPFDPALIPAFMMKALPKVDVDDDLQAEVRQFLQGINRKHQERLRARKGARKK